MEVRDSFCFSSRRFHKAFGDLLLLRRFGSEKAVKTMLYHDHGIGLDSDLGIGGRALHIAAYHQQKEPGFTSH